MGSSVAIVLEEEHHTKDKGGVGKYIEENWFDYFDTMKSTNRCILAVEALSDCQEFMADRIHLLVNWMRGQYL